MSRRRTSPQTARRAVSTPRPLAARLASEAARVRADLSMAVLDAALVALAYFAVLLLRFDGAVPAEFRQGFLVFLPLAVTVHLLVNAASGLYGQLWLHASVHEARRVLVAGVTAGVILSAVLLPKERIVPASVVVLGAVLSLLLVGAVRFQARLFAFHRGRSALEGATRILIIGAGNAGQSLLQQMQRDRGLGLLPVAVLDDDPRKRGRSIAEVPIVGPIEALPSAATIHRVDEAILAVPSADNALVQRVADLAAEAGIRLRVLPSVSELLADKATVHDIRDVEITDLLGRQQVSTDLEGVRALLHGKRVLVTGAGGSIGSEIARQVAACSPASLVLLDHDETHLFDVAAGLEAPALQVLADIRDARHLQRLFMRHRPQIVFHAAAHKHVPLLESHPVQAVSTNVLGTDSVVSTAARCGVERFVFISTDKAVHPSSVMGASKRVGEQLVLARAPENGRYCAVRFGNVLGSRGSVIPTFVRQIREGGPVTVTDERMTRYFMSIPEAVQLVLQAGALAEGGEIFMLDMGEPVRIVDLAKQMIQLSGRQIPVEITGMRPGEKLVEELRAPDEPASPTAHPSILALRPTPISGEQLQGALLQLDLAVAEHDDERAAEVLFALARDAGAVGAREALDVSVHRDAGTKNGRPHRTPLSAGKTQRSA